MPVRWLALLVAGLRPAHRSQPSRAYYVSGYIVARLCESSGDWPVVISSISFSDPLTRVPGKHVVCEHKPSPRYERNPADCFHAGCRWR